jgi:methionyl-tRNA synthetase
MPCGSVGIRTLRRASCALHGCGSGLILRASSPGATSWRHHGGRRGMTVGAAGHGIASVVVSAAQGKSAAASSSTKAVLITTPIYYVNSKPHLGHLYTSLLADSTARYHRLARGCHPADAGGREPPAPVAGAARVVFATGTDEHGLKIQEAARAAGATPTAFTDRVSSEFRAMGSAFNISADDFVRTTEARHAKVVRWLWRRLVARGHIYVGRHEGWYCTSDEAFLTESQTTTRAEFLARRATAAPTPAAAATDASQSTAGSAEDGAAAASQTTAEAAEAARAQLAILSPAQLAQRVSTESGHPVEWLAETNYRFALSAFQQPLLEWLAGGADGEGAPVLPPSRLAEVQAFVAGGLHDLSVSRPADRVGWAIPVPDDAAQSVYVWLDALANYLTVAMPRQDSASGDSQAAEELPADGDWRTLFPAWPADVHVVGKDILRFHAVYWPAFLMAAGLPPPARVVAHGHWTAGGTKMSKSLGNVVAPADLLPPAGAASVDAVRYFLLREGKIDADGDFNPQILHLRCASECADTLGNLASRTLNATFLPGGQLALPQSAADGRLGLTHTPQERELAAAVAALPAVAAEAYASVNPGRALEACMAALGAANKVFAAGEPWKLKPGKPASAQGAQAEEAEVARVARLAALLYPILETLRVTAILMAPAVPAVSAALLARLGFCPATGDAAAAAHGAWASAAYGHAPPSAYCRVDVAGGPLVLFPKHVPVPAERAVGEGAMASTGAAARAAAPRGGDRRGADASGRPVGSGPVTAAGANVRAGPAASGANASAATGGGQKAGRPQVLTGPLPAAVV